MDLQVLRYFVVTAEEEHVGRAALRLHISQSPLSRQIAKLEAELGLALFERVRQRVRLTAEGRRFLAEARQLLDHAGSVREAARRLARGEDGGLAIAYVQPAFYGDDLSGRLRRFRAARPNVTVRLIPLRSPEQAEALRQRRVDVGFAHRLPEAGGDDLDSRLISDDPFVLAIPRDHPMATAPELDAAMLGGLRWIALDRAASPGFRAEFLECCAGLGFSPDIRYETVDNQALLGLVDAGLGVALVHAGVARRGVPEGVSLRPVAAWPLRTRIHMLWRKGETSPAVHAFLGSG